MIEIQDGWTAAEVLNQQLVQSLSRDIARLNKELASALESRAEIQTNCKHMHVLFSGQEMICEVCDARIDK